MRRAVPWRALGEEALPGRQPLWLRWLLWLAILAAVTAALVTVRGDLDQAHVTLIYLVVVLGGSASGGRALGIFLSCSSFIVIDYFLQTPYGTLAIEKGPDWLVLVAFLVTAAVATQLLARAEAGAEAARQRAIEIDALAAERVRLVAEAEHAEALRQADRLKDALLASVSHDLRTPLTTIKALAHDIAGGAGEGDERATIIEEQADRLNHMVADLLDLSRLNAGGLPMEPEINAAEDLVGTAIQQAAGALHAHEVRTALAWSEPVPVGRFDFVHSLRILVNLLENAAKYSPPGTPIDIGMARQGEWLALSVADRGRGVPPAERERIFAPFYRPAGASPDAGGAGLGLSIARRLAEAQGGTLVYAEQEGGGSVFTLCLPAATLPEEESGELDAGFQAAEPSPDASGAPGDPVKTSPVTS